MARHVLLCLPALGCGLAAGLSRGLEDGIVLLQGAAESMPRSLKDKVKRALEKVDPSEVASAFTALAKRANEQALEQQQWTLGAGYGNGFGYGAGYGGMYGMPMLHQMQPAAYGLREPQMAPQMAYGQPMFYQQRSPMYTMQTMPQYQWQMQNRPMPGAPGAFYGAPQLAQGVQQGMEAFGQLQQAMQAAKDSAEGGEDGDGGAKAVAVGKHRTRDLAFVHVPSNFGHSVERAAFAGQDAEDLELAGSDAEVAQGPGGEAWGMMAPYLRQISDRTGCDLYYTPPKYWPEAVLRKYFRLDESQNRTIFGMLRDPYDKLVNEFREQSLGVLSSLNVRLLRKAISEREGSMDRESPEYQRFYEDCDVNAWVKAELTKYKDGSRFRGNCHLLPQKEYFEGPHGIQVPIDNRLIPQSFNQVVQSHGYDIQMSTGSTEHGDKCDISAWSLDAEAKALIREVYAEDFELLCQHFGYCDREELTCLRQLPHMCGGAHLAE